MTEPSVDERRAAAVHQWYKDTLATRQVIEDLDRLVLLPEATGADRAALTAVSGRLHRTTVDHARRLDIEPPT